MSSLAPSHPLELRLLTPLHALCNNYISSLPYLYIVLMQHSALGSVIKMATLTT